VGGRPARAAAWVAGALKISFLFFGGRDRREREEVERSRSMKERKRRNKYI
jgi:hypothetical protein